MRTRPAILAAAAFCLATPAISAEPAETRHSGQFNGEAIEYIALVEETLLPDPEGKPAGSLITTAYLRDGVANSAARPVIFAFNGGPGASSVPLHTRALGPRRIDGEGAERHFVDNPESPLDLADLVFIDPIGAGLSRPLASADGQIFWSTSSDAASIGYFIGHWLKAHGREASPRFLCGESYGTVRAGQIVATAKDLAFDGVMLISLVTGQFGPDMPFIATFPTFAVAAAYHGVVPAKGRSIARIFDEAAAFARTEYLPALALGDRLPKSEKMRLAKEMATRIGLSVDFIADKNLRLERNDFMMNLLKDRGVRTGQLDSRATGEFETFANRRPPYNDPTFKSPSSGSGPGPNLMQDYLTRDLGFQTAETYNGLNLDVNGKWKYDVEAARDPLAQIGAAMKEQPKLRLFWAAGYYDITTPLFAGRYDLWHAGLPRERVTEVDFASGHEVYDGANLKAFATALRAFLRGEAVR